MVKFSTIGSTELSDHNRSSDLKPQTVPYDPRFPNQNQTRYCYTSYVDFHRCKKRHSEEYEACQYFKRVYNTMCPTDWIEKWDDQVERGVFPGNID